VVHTPKHLTSLDGEKKQGKKRTFGVSGDDEDEEGSEEGRILILNFISWS